MKYSFSDLLTIAFEWLISDGIKIVLIILGSLLVSKLMIRFIKKLVAVVLVSDDTAEELGEIQRKNTLIQIFTTTSKITIFSITSMMVLQQIGIEIGPILAGAGIVGLAFGFGGQYLIRDIISGLFIIIENQYRIGDVVSIDGTGGNVEDITLRMTTLRDMDGTVHHIPHGEIKIVSNKSKVFARVNLNVGISYNANIDFVIEVLNKVGQELAEDSNWKEKIISAPQFLRVDNFGDSSIDLKIVGDTKPLKQWEITGELRKRIKAAFDKNNIEIPFPQRVVYQIKGDNFNEEV